MSAYGDEFEDLIYAVQGIASSLEEIAAGVTELANTKRVREMNMKYIQEQTSGGADS